MRRHRDDVWRALADITNEAHHSADAEPMYRAADARAVLLITAATLESLLDFHHWAVVEQVEHHVMSSVQSQLVSFPE